MEQMIRSEAIDWLFNLSVHGIKLGLRNITELLRRLGDPQNEFRCIHIAGTDGKGSTSAMTESVLRESGLRTGLYTSPHILDFNERIRVNGESISDDDMVRLSNLIRKHIDDMRKEDMLCTFFEATTAIAFAYFAEKGVEYAVIEVGMGGSFDATNIIVPDVSIITNISMEHTEYLGNTIEEIAFQKAGIIKKGVPVVTCNSGPALRVIEEVASEAGSKVTVTDEVTITSQSDVSTDMRYRGEEYRIGMPGDYQAKNASLVLDALKELPCYDRIEPHVREGLSKVYWPCRMQRIGDLIVDVSHTEAGTAVVSENIARIYGKVIMVIGVLSDKDIQGIARNMSRIASKVIITTPPSERAADTSKVCEAFSRHLRDVKLIPVLSDAMDVAMEARGDEKVLVTGSLYMAEGVMKWLKRTSVGF